MATEAWTNNITGEVREFTEGETFVMLRTTDGTEWKKGLSASEFIVCIAFAESMTKRGHLSLSKGGKKRMSKEIGASERSISESLKKLTEKNVIAHLGGGDYVMNPEIFFRRPAREMSKYIGEYYAEKEIARKRMGDLNINKIK